MKNDLSLLVASILCLAGCSGRYQVGATGSGHETAQQEGMSTAAAGTTSGNGGAGLGGTSNSLAPEPDPGLQEAEVCEPLSEPPAFAGPFAPPDVVWQRLSLLIHGEDRQSPLPLPVTVTPAWAHEVAQAALDVERAEHGKVRGIELFIESWGELGPGSLTGDWATIASQHQATLATLVAQPDPAEPERLGFFNDRVWLATHPNISERARVVMGALLHQAIPAPPAGVSLTSPDIGGTRRENLTAAVADPICNACHVALDPLGLALEHFDASGDYRSMERGQPIDASGSLQYGMMWTDEISFDAWQDLAPQLADSCDVAVGFALEYYEFALSPVGLTPAADVAADSWQDNLEEDDALRVVQRFIRGGRRIDALPLALAQSEAYLR
jgi:hypothetical protein